MRRALLVLWAWGALAGCTATPIHLPGQPDQGGPTSLLDGPHPLASPDGPGAGKPDGSDELEAEIGIKGFPDGILSGADAACGDGPRELGVTEAGTLEGGAREGGAREGGALSEGGAREAGPLPDGASAKQDSLAKQDSQQAKDLGPMH